LARPKFDWAALINGDVGVMVENIEGGVSADTVNDDNLAGPGKGGEDALNVGGFVIGKN